MTIRLPHSLFAAIVLLWSIIGFQLVAGLLNVVGYSSTTVSFVLRGIVAVIATSQVVSYFVRRENVNLALLLFGIFWAIYLTRLTHDILFTNHLLGQPGYLYFSFAIGACLLPALALAGHGKMLDADSISKWMIGSSLVFLVIVFMTGGTVVESSLGTSYDTGRLKLESINPITIGHTCVTVLLSVYWRIRFRSFRLLSAAIAFVISAFCIFILLATGSRGPLVALIIGIMFLEAVKGGRLLILATVLGAPLAAIIAFDLIALDKFFGVSLFGRLNSAMDATDMSSSMRLRYLNGAWQLFIDNPVFGGALEDPQARIYPHNILLEAYMATGIFGGTFLLILCIWALVASFKNALQFSSLAFFSVIFVQYFVACQFSSSLWSAYPFWATLGAVVGLTGRRTTSVLRNQIKGNLLSQAGLTGDYWRIGQNTIGLSRGAPSRNKDR